MNKIPFVIILVFLSPAIFSQSDTWYTDEPPLPGKETQAEKERPAPDPGVAAGPKFYTVTVDTVWDLLYLRNMNGDYASKEPAIPGSPYKYQGEGTLRFLRNTVFDDGLNSRVRFAYSGEEFGGTLQLRANADSAFQGVWDWEAWMRFFGFLKLSAGNQARRGGLEQYQRFDDFLRTKIDYVGVMLPAWRRKGVSTGDVFLDADNFPYGYDVTGMDFGYVEFIGTDHTDLLIPAGSASRSPALMIEADLEKLKLPPISVSASAGGIFDTIPLLNPWEIYANRTTYDNKYDPVSSNNINLGIRAEWTKLFNLLSLSVVYKYSAQTLEKPEAVSSLDIIDERTSSHAFGVYANILTPFDGLEVSTGYSGLLQTWENLRYMDTLIDLNNELKIAHQMSNYKKANLPYYNGVDLRLSYAGIKRLTLTMNNNLSFAGVNGSDSTGKQSFTEGWAYRGALNGNDPDQHPYRIEYYVGLYNALGANFVLPGGKVDLNFQAANRLGIFTLIWQDNPVRSFTDSLGIFAGAVYRVNIGTYLKAALRGGMAFRINSYSYQEANAARPVHKAGFLEFAIPIGIRIDF